MLVNEDIVVFKTTWSNCCTVVHQLHWAPLQ